MAYGDYARTTELEAVNTCLSVIGEQPVNSINTSGVSKASLARDLVYSTSRRIQNEGLNCNSEVTTLSPNVSNNIELPVNCLSVEPVNEADNKYVERNGKLYDRVDNTFTITSSVQAKITYFLTWDELPEHVRSYITIVAARIFQTRYVSDETLHTFSEADEAKAQAKFARLELDTTSTTGVSFGQTKTSELDIVNTCLSLIKEIPQNSLTSVGSAKVKLVRSMIHQTSRRLQSEGLNCNTEIKTLSPSAGEITIPSDCISVEPTDLTNNKYVERNGKLYDRVNNTFTISEDVTVKIVSFLTFDELPEHVRNYIAILVIRLFQEKYMPESNQEQSSSHPFSELDEAKAQAKFARLELAGADILGTDRTYVKSGELEVINLCLNSVKETPQSSLTNLGTPKARFAKDLLHNISRTIQSQKLNCNTNIDVTLTPDESSEIPLPANCLDFEPIRLWDADLVEKNGKVYDNDDQTFQITKTVRANLVLFLSFDELPEHVREYIKIRTVRLFQKKYLPDVRYHTFTPEDEYYARAEFLRKEYKNAKVSILDNTNVNPRFYRRGY